MLKSFVVNPSSKNNITFYLTLPDFLKDKQNKHVHKKGIDVDINIFMNYLHYLLISAMLKGACICSNFEI